MAKTPTARELLAQIRAEQGIPQDASLASKPVARPATDRRTAPVANTRTRRYSTYRRG